MNEEDLPKGNAPNGLFYPAETASADFFSKESEIAKKNLIRTRLPFLHAIIYSKIEKWNVERQDKRLKRKTSMANGSSTLNQTGTLRDEEVEGETEDGQSDLNHLEELDGICDSKEIEPDKLDAQRLEQVGVTFI